MYLITDIQQVYTQLQEQASAIGGLQSEVGAMHGAIKELPVKQGNYCRPQHYEFESRVLKVHVPF